MTPTQRAAMQQALEALDDCRHGCEEPHKTASAVTGLRAALAEPSDKLPLLKDEEISLEAHNIEPEDWDDLRAKRAWHEGFKEGARAIEQIIRQKVGIR